jgi:glycosyltransferase involved in cell wall biosynthesis
VSTTGGVRADHHARDTRVTVLLPLRHYHPQYLREALQSIFAQTSSDWRLLIVVEPEDVARFRSLLSDTLEDSRVRLVPSEGRKLAGAFNTGMRAAETEFVAILLGDDLWAPHAVETLQASILAHPEADFFHSGRRVIDGDGRHLSSVHPPTDHFEAADFIWKSPVKHLLCWRRTKALSFGGMDDSLNNVGPDDYDFPWTMLEHGAVFRSVPECLYLFRDHRDAYRLTTHLPRNVHLRELRRILRKHGVGTTLIAKRLWRAKRDYLRECLYRNRLDRWFKRVLRFDPKSGWRQEYR